MSVRDCRIYVYLIEKDEIWVKHVDVVWERIDDVPQVLDEFLFSVGIVDFHSLDPEPGADNLTVRYVNVF